MTANNNFATQFFLAIATCVGLWYFLEGCHYTYKHVDLRVDLVWINPDTSVPTAPTDAPVPAAMAGVVRDAQPPVDTKTASDDLQMTEGEKSVDAIRREYIDKYKAVAQAEQRKFGIPASITLAQGLLESGAGNGKLVKDTNNHFGIKCISKTCKRGHCKNFTDDTHKDFFICYKSGWESYREHSKFLKNTPRYRNCFKATTYKGFAQALETAGYATLKDANGERIYADVLIRLIRLYHLDRYDQIPS